MSLVAKVFQYQVDGLSYTVTIYEENGGFFADITVNEGAMDVNAVYFGDDDFSGASAGLKGPLNMNGGGSLYDGETVQWDDAIKLSDPGLGRAGAEKATYLTAGETFTLELDIDSLDDIDFFGVRATSTTTDSGSIKGVSGDPEEHDEPEEPLYDKVFFIDSIEPFSGAPILAEPDPDSPGSPALPPGTEPTFENYVSHYQFLGGNVNAIDEVEFYDIDDNGKLTLLFEIVAPDGGFENVDELLAAHDDAVDDVETTDSMMASLLLDSDSDGLPFEGESEDLDELAIV